MLYIFLHPSHSCCLAVWGLSPCSPLKPLWRVRSYIISSCTLFHYEPDEISNLVSEAMSNLALCLVQGYWPQYPSFYLNQKQQLGLLLFILLSWVWLKHLKSNYKQGSSTLNVWNSYNIQYAKWTQHDDEKYFLSHPVLSGRTAPRLQPHSLFIDLDSYWFPSPI